VSPRKLYNFYIDPELAEGLKALKTRDGITEGEAVRRALKKFLSQKGVMKTDRKRASTRKRS
jgi:hypothetical protein